MGPAASRLLKETQWSLPLDSVDWKIRTWATILDVWLRLIRKKGWSDRDAVLENVAKLRDSQQEFERNYFAKQAPLKARNSALELICLYHLAKAAEILAHLLQMVLLTEIIKSINCLKHILIEHWLFVKILECLNWSLLHAY